MKNLNIFNFRKKFFENKKKYNFNFNNNKLKLIVKKKYQIIINKYSKIKSKTNKLTSIFFNTLSHNLIILDKKNKEYSKLFTRLKGYKLIEYFKDKIK